MMFAHSSAFLIHFGRSLGAPPSTWSSARRAACRHAHDRCLRQLKLGQLKQFLQRCRPASSAPAAGGSSMLKTAKIGGATVLTNAKGFTLYWFAPDTPTTSKCNGSCASLWPPVKGPATAGAGVTGKLATITRSDGSVQATYNGHPLYTYSGDSAPGQAEGNGLNLSGGVWHEVTASGAAAPASSKSASSGGGYGY
jgi:predicted lipoprotein with Yx(FWY)xxD motif